MSNNELLMKYYDRMVELFDKYTLPEDLRQMIFLAFLEKDNAILTGLDERGELMFYMVKGVKNQFFSKSSQYHKLFKEFEEKTVSIEEVKEWM